MADPLTSITRVSSVEQALAASGVSPSKDLTDAIDAYRQTKSELPAIDVAAEVARTNADGMLELRERLALNAVLREADGPNRGLLGDLYARRVVAAFGRQLEECGDAMAAQFDPVAAEFVEVLGRLPESHVLGDAQHIAQRGTETLTLWGRGRDLAATLDGFARTRNSLVDLGYTSLLPAIIDARTRFAEPSTHEALDALGGVTTIPGFGAWASRARVAGVIVRWVKPSEQRNMVANLEAQRPQTKPNRQRRLVRP